MADGESSGTADEEHADAVKTDVSFHSQGVTAETVLRLSDSIRKRERELVAREAKVGKREEQVRFMLEDLKRERQEIGGMLELAEKRAGQSRIMLEESQSRETIAPTNNGEGGSMVDADQISTTTTDNQGNDENLEIIANWLQAMPPEQAADSIRLMCNDGKMDMVVQVLVYIEERNTAKILGALQDPGLVAEILDRFRMLEKEK